MKVEPTPIGRQLLKCAAPLVLAVVGTACTFPQPPAPKPEPSLQERREQFGKEREAEKRRLESLKTDKQRQLEAEAAAREKKEAEEHAAEIKKQREVAAEERRKWVATFPAFRAQLKTGDRVGFSYSGRTALVVEVKRPLVLVQFDPNRDTPTFETRWVEIEKVEPLRYPG